jgi:hypothetical protein
MKTQQTLFDMDAPASTSGIYDDLSFGASRRNKPVASKPLQDAGKLNRNDTYVATAPRHTGDRLRVMNHLESIGAYGATRDELSITLSMPLTTVCGRVRELLDLGAVIETDQRRVTRTGSTAVVLQAARGAK